MSATAHGRLKLDRLTDHSGQEHVSEFHVTAGHCSVRSAVLRNATRILALTRGIVCADACRHLRVYFSYFGQGFAVSTRHSYRHKRSFP
jgi:hypothetical protein